jgi:predicted 3-demethylubiquinone-9 3-methyltransferase (glyoxalase superfamily)
MSTSFYTSIFPNSSIDKVHRASVDTPGTKEGAVLFIEFTLSGQKYQLINGGPHHTFNDAISLSVDCADQAEVDRYWSALTAGGGTPVQCGWLKDKYGLSWQIVPRRMLELLGDPDRMRARRAMEAMMGMVKLDVAKLEAAADGQ